MSNRSLLEFNHDYTGRIELTGEYFIKALRDYLTNPSEHTAESLKLFGVSVLGFRHHSEKYVTKPGGLFVQD